MNVLRSEASILSRLGEREKDTDADRQISVLRQTLVEKKNFGERSRAKQKDTETKTVN